MSSGIPRIFAHSHSSTAGEAAGKAGAHSRANLLTLALALGLTLVIHMVPWGGPAPLGAFLLPMFWAAFVAVYLYGPWAALLVALLGPPLNTFLTRFPEVRLNTVMTFELIVFVIFSWLVLRNPRARGFWLLAPAAYVVAKGCSSALRAAGFDFWGDLAAAGGTFFMRSVSNGAIGLLLLAVINFALVRGWFGTGGKGGADGHGPHQAA